jgi:hypothetical protein
MNIYCNSLVGQTGRKFWYNDPSAVYRLNLPEFPESPIFVFVHTTGIYINHNGTGNHLESLTIIDDGVEATPVGGLFYKKANAYIQSKAKIYIGTPPFFDQFPEASRYDHIESTNLANLYAMCPSAGLYSLVHGQPVYSSLPIVYRDYSLKIPGFDPVSCTLGSSFKPKGFPRLTDDGYAERDFECLGIKKTVFVNSFYNTSYSNSNPFYALRTHLINSNKEESLRAWNTYFKIQAPSEDWKGLFNILKKNEALFDEIEKEHPVVWLFLNWMTSSSTYEKTTNNKLLASFFTKMEFSKDKIVEALYKLLTNPGLVKISYWYHNPGVIIREYVATLEGAQEALQDAEAKTDYTKLRTETAKADTLGITEDKYPILRALVVSSEIPSNVFREINDLPVNREFELWEEALSVSENVEGICAIAKNASGRTTYGREITPYLSFVLYTLPEYLNKYTGYKWTCRTKYVSSQWQLEMDEADENGTVKRRSAMTPIVDNENKIVTVPYVGLSVGGARTQYCYSYCYRVYSDMYCDPHRTGVAIKGVMEKLNGRDDYGTMYYSLTGTNTASGYPTFLIIFERKTEGTTVHFHRTHPKNTARANDLIPTLYEYMTGGVPVEEVSAQQGDMIYTLRENDPVASGAKVEEPVESNSFGFESHTHKTNNPEENLKLFVSTSATPKNRLGFIYVPEGGIEIDHPEHENAHLSEGIYEIRRCKSWEANPVAIWSYTID